MNKLITILSCKPNEEGKKGHVLRYTEEGDEDKIWKKSIFAPHTTFANAHIGEKAALTTEKKGEYWNITALEDPSAMAASAASGNGGGGFTADPNKINSIEEQVCIKEIGEDLRAGLLEKEGMLSQKRYLWMAEKLERIKIPIRNKDGKGIFASEEDKREVWDALGDEEYNKWLGDMMGDPTTEDCKKKLQTEKKAKK